MLIQGRHIEKTFSLKPDAVTSAWRVRSVCEAMSWPPQDRALVQKSVQKARIHLVHTTDSRRTSDSSGRWGVARVALRREGGAGLVGVTSTCLFLCQLKVHLRQQDLVLHIPKTFSVLWLVLGQAITCVEGLFQLLLVKWNQTASLS